MHHLLCMIRDCIDQDLGTCKPEKNKMRKNLICLRSDYALLGHTRLNASKCYYATELTSLGYLHRRGTAQSLIERGSLLIYASERLYA